MKKFLTFFTIISITLIFSGCSQKSQINPTTYQKSDISEDFSRAQDEYKKEQMLINKGKQIGYEEAKAEIEKLLPYFEGIRAAAEINKAGGLCIGPLFQDKSDSGSIKLVVGDVHICEEYTVESLIKIAKEGIPGLPKSTAVSSNGSETKNTQQGFTPSSISLPNETNNFTVTRPYAEITEAKNIKVKNTLLNQEILKGVTANHSTVEEQINGQKTNYLLVTFKSASDADAFCSKYTICQ
jgi:hypothetical protein